jgi:hypothetical protein
MQIIIAIQRLIRSSILVAQVHKYEIAGITGYIICKELSTM